MAPYIPTEAYYDSYWLMARTLPMVEPNDSNNLLIVLFITRKRLTLSNTNGKFEGESVNFVLPLKEDVLMKKKIDTSFEQFKLTLSKTDLDDIAYFFTEFNGHNSLAPKEKARMRLDFEKAILYYSSIGVPLVVALARLSIENLGGFYVRPSIQWFVLDDAAKIYPLSMKRGQMSVFRLSVYLKQPVIPELLQMALTFTIKRFPSFATTVKKGFFWHYLSSAKRRYSVAPESNIPCSFIEISKSGSQSFRVLYNANRISVEYFHVLTDGTGGIVFLKTLTAEYLRLLGITSDGDEGILNVNDTPTTSETANEFSRADKTEKTSGFVDKPAVQMSGKLAKKKPCRVYHFKMDASALKKVAKGKNATITAYILALMFVAGKHATDELEGNLNTQIPVNMRKYYPSSSLRNFSMYCGIKLPLRDITDVDSILEEISNQLTTKASKQSLSEMMNSTEQMIKLMQHIPLFLKSAVARIVYGYLGENIFSDTLSNLGVVTMPRELEEQIDYMDFVLGPAATNRVNCAMVTFGNTAMLSITKMTADPSFEEKLLSMLLSEGIETVVQGSELYES